MFAVLFEQWTDSLTAVLVFLSSSRYFVCADSSYPLFVEPRLIGNLDVVSVRVADVCREVVGTPFGSKARFLDCSSSRVYRRMVAGPDSVRAPGGKCDVKVFDDFAIFQPETRNVIDSETA